MNNTNKIGSNAKIKKIIIGIVAVAVMATAAVSVVGCRDQSQNDQEVIKIGAIIPLTGGAAVFGKYNNEATIASLEILSKGIGINYSLSIEDSKTSPKDAVNAYMKMRAVSKPKIVATELSSIAMALFPAVAQDNKLLIAIATAEDLQKEVEAIQIYPSSQQIYECLSLFLEHKEYSEDVTVYYINDDFGKSVCNKLQSKNQRFLAIPFDGNTDVRSLVAKGNNKCAVVVGYGSPFLAIIRELQTLDASQYIIASPEFAFPEFYNAVDISRQNLYFMEFENYESLNEILSPKLGRPVHPLDFLVFGGYLASMSAAKELLKDGEEITGKKMYSKIVGKQFSYCQYVQSFDEFGTAIYNLSVSPASNLSKRH